MIYFIRHGATDWNDFVDENGNKNPRYQGRTNLGLNERGVRQALKVQEQICGIKFQKVLCSPLKRAQETCKLITRQEITTDERLVERDFGEFTGLTKKDFDYNAFWQEGSCQKFERAETIGDVKKRVFSLLEELKEFKDENILIVSHSGIGRVMCSYFFGEPENGNYLKFDISNGQTIQFDYDKVNTNKNNQVEEVCNQILQNVKKAKEQEPKQAKNERAGNATFQNFYLHN